MSQENKPLPSLYQRGLEVFAVTGLLSLKTLLHDNMGVENEVDVLPLARQFIDSTWVPGDWYLHQPAGYRVLFNTIVGQFIVAWGFLAASIVGRLACYSLIALGLVQIGRLIGLRLPLLLSAIGLFLYVQPRQGMVALEWIVGGVEAKAVAYGFVLLALGWLVQKRYRWMALGLGIATSFHVLVGGWAFLTALGWLLGNWLLGSWRLGDGQRSHWKTYLQQISRFGSVILIYLAGSVFVLPTVVRQLAVPAPDSLISPSFIYVFLRLPHHLNPLVWKAGWWIRPIVYLLILMVSMIVLWRWRAAVIPEQQQAQVSLFGFTLISLIPFIAGVLIALFDRQGSLLQFYPFHLGDVMLPLHTCLLSACAIQQSWTGQKQQVLSLICVAFLASIMVDQVPTFQQQVSKLHHFPRLSSEVEAIFTWIRTETPANATVITSPMQYDDFTWMTERATIAKHKLLPQTKVGILEWYERLSDLSGATIPPLNDLTNKKQLKNFKQKLKRGYNRLTTAQVNHLMTKYSARYFMTHRNHHLNLPIAYLSHNFVLYKRKAESEV